jgi:hypothetical protein
MWHNVKGKTLTNIEITASDDAVVEAAIVYCLWKCSGSQCISPNGDGINENTDYSITDTTCYPSNTVEI